MTRLRTVFVGIIPNPKIRLVLYFTSCRSFYDTLRRERGIIMLAIDLYTLILTFSLKEAVVKVITVPSPFGGCSKSYDNR
jgi:hypothetical protein